MDKEYKIFRDKFFWLSMVVAGFLLTPTLWFGFGMDQSIYSYGAWVWRNYHEPPYVGVWDHNFPGIFLLSRAAMELFGESMLGFRIFDYLVQLSGLAMIFYLAKKLSGSGIASFLACVLYSFYYVGLGRWDAGQRDAFIFWFLLGAVFCSVRLDGRVWLRAAAMGLFAGCAALVRPTYGLVWPVFGIFLLIDGFRVRPKQVWLELFVFGSCCCLPSLSVLLYYWQTGHVSELYESIIFYNFSVYSKLKAKAEVQSRLGAFWQGLNPLVAGQPLAALLALPAVLFQVQNRGRERTQGKILALTLSLLAVIIINLLIMGKVQQYHLIPWWGFLIVLSAPGISFMVISIGNFSSPASIKTMVAVFYLALAVMAFAAMPSKWAVFDFQHDFRDLKSAYLSRVDYKDLLLTENHYMAAQYLNSVLLPEDRVVVFGGHPLIYFLIKKKNPSRFVLVQHLLHSPTPRYLSPTQKNWIREYTRDMISARPRFFVIAGMDFAFSTGVPATTFREGLRVGFPELESFLESNYRLTKTIGTTEIYELLPEKPSAPAGEGNK